MKRTLKDVLIDTETLEEVVYGLDLRPKETEMVILKLSILIENRLLEWILKQLSLADQKQLVDILMKENTDPVSWLERKIPDFTTQARQEVASYQEDLIVQIQELKRTR